MKQKELPLKAALFFFQSNLNFKVRLVAKFYTMILRLLFVAIVLVSCDPGVKYKKIVENRSEYDVTIYSYTSVVDNPTPYDSVTILKKSNGVLYSYDGIGQPDDFIGCESQTDSIYVKVLDYPNLKCTNDLSNASNWVYLRLTSGSMGGECECRTALNSDMFE